MRGIELQHSGVYFTRHTFTLALEACHQPLAVFHSIESLLQILFPAGKKIGRGIIGGPQFERILEPFIQNACQYTKFIITLCTVGLK